MTTKEEIIKGLYSKYPRKEAELFERVLIPILEIQKQEIIKMAERMGKLYTNTKRTVGGKTIIMSDILDKDYVNGYNQALNYLVAKLNERQND